MFLKAPNVSLRGMKAQLYEYGGRILLGDNIDGGAVMKRPISFQGDGVWVSSVPPLTKHTCARFRLASERKYFIRQGV
jgi:hypothetical protein